MKYKGKTVTPPAPKKIAFPRADGPIVFTCGPVLDYTEFDNICPMPKPPVIQRIGKEPINDTKDKRFIAAVDTYALRKTQWMVLQSLNATEDLEWETVDMLDPETWNNYNDELAAVFTEREIEDLLSAVFEVNAPTPEARQQAIDSFMSLQRDPEEPVHMLEKDAPQSISSGVPVKD